MNRRNDHPLPRITDSDPAESSAGAGSGVDETAESAAGNAAVGAAAKESLGEAEARERSTRDRLIDAAMELFHANGFHATGIAAILKRADVNSGSLYYFFPTKEDLLRAILERYKVLLRPIIIDPVYSRVTDPIERIFGVLEGYRQMLIATGCSLGCPIGNLALELSDTHDNIRRLVAENFEGWRLAIRECLDDAADRLPPGVDRDALATFVLTVMEGAMMQAKAHKSLDRFEQSVAQLRDHFERLLADGCHWGSA
jgi:TetR/AcrR family transcriptional repressor of nem operon